MRKGNKKIAVMATAAILVMAGMSSYAATSHWNDASLSSDSTAWSAWKTTWETVKDDYEKLSLTPGADETQLNFAWYSHMEESPKVRYATTRDGVSSGVECEGIQESTTISYLDTLKESLEGQDGTYYSNKVTITGLEENKTYYYQVYQNGLWSEVKKYQAKDFQNYSVLYIGDPQIGACKNQTSSENETMSGSIAARNDSYNWNEIITDAWNNHKVSFMISAGDQVNSASNEYEYAGFLYPSVMEAAPLATTIGNHDSGSYSYTWHFNNPNSFDIYHEVQSGYTDGHTNAGSDYYYTYGNVLYIVLDTNNYNCATHENVIAKAVEENPDCTWRVVTFHHDIYGSGADHANSDGMILRTQLTPLMDKYDIDVVLQGHDHTYSRSYQLTSDGKDHTAYNKSSYQSDEDYLNQNNCYNLCSTKEDGDIVANPEGTVYFEANSATGSKYYELSSVQQDYIAERSQTWTPSYSVIDVTDSTFRITTYDATTNNILENSSTYTIVKDTQVVTDISKEAKVDDITAKIYTGKEIKPECKITVGDVVLTEGTDYTVTYTDNINVGTGTVSIKGKGDYTGTLTKKFKIQAASVQEKKITLSKTNYVYDGNKKQPSVKIKGLKNGTDYKVSYQSNKNIGTAKVIINGIGNYTGKVTKTFKIGLKKPTLKITPGSKKVTLKWSKISGADGYVIYSSNKKSGIYSKVITIKKKTTVKYVNKKLKKGNTYYYKIRAYKNMNGKKTYSDYSKTVKAKVN